MYKWSKSILLSVHSDENKATQKFNQWNILLPKNSLSIGSAAVYMYVYTVVGYSSCHSFQPSFHRMVYVVFLHVFIYALFVYCLLACFDLGLVYVRFTGPFLLEMKFCRNFHSFCCFSWGSGCKLTSSKNPFRSTCTCTLYCLYATQPWIFYLWTSTSYIQLKLPFKTTPWCSKNQS